MAYNTFSSKGIDRIKLNTVDKVKLNYNNDSSNTVYNDIPDYSAPIDNKHTEEATTLPSKKYIKNYEKLDYKNISDEGYIPQSITSMDDKIIIGAYKKGHNSYLYIYDKDGNYIKKIELDYRSHVGGIAYDPDNKLFFVTEKDGRVIVYDSKFIEDAIEKGDIKLPDIEAVENDENVLAVFDATKGDQNAACVCYYDGKVYVPTYNGTKKGVMTVYTVNKDEKEVTFTEEYRAECPVATQGVTVTEYQNKKYILFNSAAGFGHIRGYILHDNGEMEYCGITDSQIAGEGIYADDNGTIAHLSELSAFVPGAASNLNTYDNMGELINEFETSDDSTIHYIGDKFGGTKYDNGLSSAFFSLAEDNPNYNKQYYDNKLHFISDNLSLETNSKVLKDGGYDGAINIFLDELNKDLNIK